MLAVLVAASWTQQETVNAPAFVFQLRLPVGSWAVVYASPKKLPPNERIVELKRKRPSASNATLPPAYRKKKQECGSAVTLGESAREAGPQLRSREEDRHPTLCPLD